MQQFQIGDETTHWLRHPLVINWSSKRNYYSLTDAERLRRNRRVQERRIERLGGLDKLKSKLKKERESLTDNYVKKQLCLNSKLGFRDIAKELVEVKRELIRLNRLNGGRGTRRKQNKI
jgi:CelD/BcsL family acetyltransferase involved in cellulose biosynthesis